MCKVMAIPKITDKTREDCWIFAQLLSQLMSPGNNDGLGYAAFNKKGDLFGEKWLINATAFQDLSQIKGVNSNKIDKIYSFFGDKVLRDETQAIILHTRAATCGKGILNVHPFVDDEDDPSVAIIHNGMIFNENIFKRKYSTCDSEVLAHLYAEHKMNKDLSKLNDFADKMRGWYTVLALSKDDKGKMIMDAFSDTRRLGSYFIKELDTRIYSTYAQDVLSVAKTLGLTAVEPEQLGADKAMRIDVLSGEQTHHLKFKSRVEYEGGWTNWNEDIIVADGNLDDEEFRNRWFGMNGWGRHD